MTIERYEHVALVTGGTGAIGRAIAQGLAERGWALVITARDERKAERVAGELRKAAGHDRVRWERVDLGRRAEIDTLARRWRGPLHALINNAATAPRRREETPEGIERQWAVNVLGYHWLIEAFAPVLAANAPARIVNVASYWAGGLDFSDPEFKRRAYDNDAAYRQSKQADRMLAAGWAAQLNGQGITVNSCHPGDVPSTLSHDLGFGGHETPDQGAATPMWLATGELGGQVSGRYFEARRETICRFSRDAAGVQRLMELCNSWV